MIDNIKDFEKEEARRLLNKYGVPINFLGYKYLVTAMPYTIEKISLNEKIIFSDLYKYIAKKHKTTANKVHGAIRYLCDFTNIAEKINIPKITNQKLITNMAMSLVEKYNL